MTEPRGTMRAAYVERLGDAAEIRVGSLAVPSPAADEVLVRVEAAAVNRVDTLIRSGRYPTPLPEFPFVVGRDLVGEVVDAGPAARGFGTGARVWCNSIGYAGRHGSAAEFAVVPEERLHPLPDGLDPVQAVAALHPAATAYVGLVRHAGGVGPGDVVVVGGAAGNVGSCVTALASAHGATVVALARPRDADWCREHGAAAVVDFGAPDLRAALAEVADLLPGGADVWFDTSGRIDLELAVETMAEHGTILLTAAAPTPPTLPVTAFYQKSLRLHGFVITTASLPDLDAAAGTIVTMLARGQLDVRVGHVLALDQAADAHRLVEKGTRGRVVLRIG